ncbi:MAG: cytochrome c biogenesis protein CcsA [Saprospiraceae bacterium]|nr:cytochrome c biogenesis protein [Bacteroidia bacterium]NNF21367.1 cytochrome c biogenesis protein CcsA [Saprospiraceae bacterium]
MPDDRLIKADSIVIKDEVNLEAYFSIPNNLPDISNSGILATIIVDNEKDGYAIYPQGFRVRKGTVVSSENAFQDFYELSEIRHVDGIAFPFRNILYETIRNTFFHVAIWFAMFLLLVISCFYSIRYLRLGSYIDDLKSSSLTTVAIYFGMAGIITGSIWAKFTWGTFWTSDIKLNMSAIALLIYLAYLVLRNSISDVDSKARISAVYNLFAFVCLMILVMVIPRLTDSLHPGNGGNPALGGEDLDNTLRMVFYPAIIAYTLLGIWMAQLFYRYKRLKMKIKLKE